MRFLVAVSAAVALVVLSAYARLGETPDEVAKRYGQPLETPHTQTNEYSLNYNHADYFITVTFWNGKSAQEDIRASVSMDDADARTLFKTISGKLAYTVEDLGGTTHFKAEGISADFSRNSDFSSTLKVYDNAYRKHFREVMDAEKKKKLDSF